MEDVLALGIALAVSYQVADLGAVGRGDYVAVDVETVADRSCCVHRGARPYGRVATEYAMRDDRGQAHLPLLGLLWIELRRGTNVCGLGTSGALYWGTGI